MIQPIVRTCASFEQLKICEYLIFVLGNLPHLKACFNILQNILRFSMYDSKNVNNSCFPFSRGISLYFLQY